MIELKKEKTIHSIRHQNISYSSLSTNIDTKLRNKLNPVYWGCLKSEDPAKLYINKY